MNFDDYKAFTNNMWITKTGEWLLIEQMSSNHIKNCIQLIKKTYWRTYYLSLLLKEYKKRIS